MPDREKILGVIDRAYAARQSSDKEALRSFFAPGAEFRIVGQGRLIDGFPVGPADAVETVDELIDLFQFHRMDRLQVMIDGDAVMIRWAVETSCSGGPCVETELCDIWTLGDDGKVTSIVEFADTALIADMLAVRAKTLV
jgi:ketosteroid isomerase-like protein